MSHLYQTETKAAVLAALLAGQAVMRVAAQFNIPQSTVSTWKGQLSSVVPSAPSTPPSIPSAISNPSTIQPIQKKEIGDLLVQHLQVSLETLTAQAEFFKDRNWLDKQSAGDVAVLHGVMSDKLFRMVEFLGKAYAASNSPPQD